MKHCKKIISSILTLTLFAGSVVNLTCFAAGPNSDKPNIEQAQQEKSNAFNRCRNYTDELDKIKNSVNEKSSLADFNKACKRIINLTNQLNENKKLSKNEKTALANQIESTLLYLLKKTYHAPIFLFASV